jgi:hypothetical protein
MSSRADESDVARLLPGHGGGKPQTHWRDGEARALAAQALAAEFNHEAVADLVGERLIPLTGDPSGGSDPFTPDQTNIRSAREVSASLEDQDVFTA